MYSASEIEFLSCVWAITQCKNYLTNHFYLETDHKCLIYLKNFKTNIIRLLRWSLEIQDLDFTVSYRKGNKNGAADALSQLDHSRMPAEDDICDPHPLGHSSELESSQHTPSPLLPVYDYGMTHSINHDISLHQYRNNLERTNDLINSSTQTAATFTPIT